MKPLYAVGVPIDLLGPENIWMSLTNWKPDRAAPGAIKVGSRWQPIKARCVARPDGYFSHWSSACATEARGYKTRNAAMKAARAILNGEASRKRAALIDAGRPAAVVAEARAVVGALKEEGR